MVDGILIAPTWDKPNYDRLYKIIEENDLRLIHEETFKKGFSFKADMGIDELIEKFGQSAIKKAKKIGERSNANICLMYPKRGFGKLEVNAQYFSLNN
jgi:hypothetical protein